MEIRYLVDCCRCFKEFSHHNPNWPRYVCANCQYPFPIGWEDGVFEEVNRIDYGLKHNKRGQRKFGLIIESYKERLALLAK